MNKVKARIYTKSVNVELGRKQIMLIDKICADFGQNKQDFIRESLEYVLRKISEKHYAPAVEKSYEDMYNELYSIWVSQHCLMPNPARHYINPDLVKKVVEEHGFDKILEAVNIYGTIFRNTKKYNFVPESTIDEFLSKYLNKFLPDAIPSAHHRYMRPRLVTKPEILKFTKPKKGKIELPLELKNNLREMNKLRIKRSLKPMTPKQYIKATDWKI